ncbi:MAG: hypothetical protein U0350_06115 [Caldilineaceae bacterium]
MDITLLDPPSSNWPTQLDQLYAELGGASNATLFPYHFLQATFPRIGGQIAIGYAQGAPAIMGFLFPRWREPNASPQCSYTLRQHLLDDLLPDQAATAFVDQVRTRLGNQMVQLYEPGSAQAFAPTHHLIGPIDIGRPDAAEAAQIRHLQQQIWRSAPGSLYPADIHSVDFRLGTSLVARLEGELVGFLFGFYKFSETRLPADWMERFNGALRIESQVLGVLPEYRGLRLGFWLKKVQAENAQAEGIHVINWTVDPLQYPNAMLNFGLLHGVAFDFMPDYYPAFRNDLNQLPASRFSITWLISSAYVQQRLAEGSQAQVVNLAEQPSIMRVNDGCQQVDYGANARQIAIEIPANWTTLQHDDPAEAAQWRKATDSLFQHYIGRNAGQYVVTNVGRDGERRFLLAEQVSDALWERLGQV